MGSFCFLTMVIFMLRYSTKVRIYYRIVGTCLFNLIHVFCLVRVVFFNVIFVLGSHRKEPYVKGPPFFWLPYGNLVPYGVFICEKPHVC